MTSIPIFKKLHQEGLISEESFQKVMAVKSGQLVSVHWELKTMLYLGVLMLSSSLGILIYNNIDSIGHKAVLAIIAAISLACFVYCFVKAKPYANTKVASPGVFFDYALLLGCLTFVIFIAYLQYQYNVFGSRYGLASFITLSVLFFSAYFFDNIGVLSLAITNFATWLGISITPLRILQQNDFNNGRIILTGILIGVLLLIAGFVTRSTKVKAHFEFAYTNFGTHIFFIAALAAIAHYESIMLWLLLGFLGIVALFYIYAYRRRSFYFLVVSILYGYIGLSYVIVQLLTRTGSFGLGPIYMIVIYFILSGVALAGFLVYLNKQLKGNDSI